MLRRSAPMRSVLVAAVLLAFASCPATAANSTKSPSTARPTGSGSGKGKGSHNSCSKGSKNCLSVMMHGKGCGAKPTESHHLLAGKCVRAWDIKKGKADNNMVKAMCLANGTVAVAEYEKANDCSGKPRVHMFAPNSCNQTNVTTAGCAKNATTGTKRPSTARPTGTKPPSTKRPSTTKPSKGGSACSGCNASNREIPVKGSCRAGTNTRCLTCPKNTFANQSNATWACAACSICDALQGRRVLRACTNTTTTVCKLTDCGSPPNVSHGTVKADATTSSSGELHRYRATASVRCDEKYVGDGKIECASDGRWTKRSCTKNGTQAKTAAPSTAAPTAASTPYCPRGCRKGPAPEAAAAYDRGDLPVPAWALALWVIVPLILVAGGVFVFYKRQMADKEKNDRQLDSIGGDLDRSSTDVSATKGLL